MEKELNSCSRVCISSKTLQTWGKERKKRLRESNFILNQATRARGEGWAGSDLLHIRVEAKSSLYLSTESSLNRDFTLLMWVDRWILQRESRASRSQRGEQGNLPRAACTGSFSLLKLVDLFVVIRQLCGK